MDTVGIHRKRNVHTVIDDKRHPRLIGDFFYSLRSLKKFFCRAVLFAQLYHRHPAKQCLAHRVFHCICPHQITVCTEIQRIIHITFFHRSLLLSFPVAGFPVAITEDGLRHAS